MYKRILIATEGSEFGGKALPVGPVVPAFARDAPSNLLPTSFQAPSNLLPNAGTNR
jgi:hypothetical protein